MPNFVAYIGASVLTTVGAGAAAATFATSLWVGAATLGVATYAARRSMRLRDGASSPGVVSHELLVRGTTEPRKIVYGEALVSGPIFFNNVTGADNRELYFAIALTGHEIQSFQGVFLDDKFVPWADVDDLGGGGDGGVDADTNSHGYGPVGSAHVLYIREHLGASGQTVDTMLDSAFTEWTSNHRARGCAYAVVRMDKLVGAEEVWERGAPGNISFLIRGKKVYDPRLDSTQPGGSGSHRLATPSTWAYSSNSALCLADYLIDSDLGAGFDSSLIDYASVMTAADACDANVAIPVATTQDRFTCNGVLLCADSHKENIEKILSSMAGSLRYYNGLWRIRAGTFPSTDFTLSESHLIGPIRFRYGPEDDDRFNAVRGVYFDPDRQYKESQYLSTEDATLQSARDDGLTLWKDLDLPMTNNEYMAQRIAFRALNQAANTGVCIFPTGYNGLNIAPGDTGTVTNTELGWSSKVFRCIGMRHVDLVGVELVLLADDSASYADPAEGDYGTRTAAGEINFPGIPLATVGVVVDPMFTLPIGESWIVGAGSGVSIQVGGGEGGGNALQLTNTASVTQAAYNGRMFDTAPGEIIAGLMRVQKTADVQSVIVRTSYYRRDTLASLGTVDQDVTALIATNGTYYTVPWRQHTPTTYTLANNLRLKARLEIRMVPDGSGTATATVSSFNATRLGIVGTSEIDREAATSVYQAADAGGVAVSVPNGTTSNRDWFKYIEVTGLQSTDYVEVVASLNVTLTALGGDPTAVIAAAYGTTTPSTASQGYSKVYTNAANQLISPVGTFTGITGTMRFGVECNITHTSSGSTATATAFNIELQVTVVRR